MPLEMLKEGVKVARTTETCPCCGKEIHIKYNAETKEIMYVLAGYDRKTETLTCYECQAELKWKPPQDE